MIQLSLDLTVSDTIPPKTLTHSIWFHHPQHMADISLSSVAAQLETSHSCSVNRKE